MSRDRKLRRRPRRERGSPADDVAETERLRDLEDLQRRSEAAMSNRAESTAVEAPREVDPADERGTLVSIFSGTDRKGPWEPPAKLQVFTLFGGAEVDYSEAEMLEGVSEIEVFVMFGGVTVRVPTDIDVSSQGLALFGGFSHFSQRADEPDPPMLRVRGLALFGGVEVKGPKRRKRRRGRP